MKFGINKIGHAQLAEVTRIPKPYYDKMLAEEPMLLADNVNTWFTKNATKQLFRTQDGKLRALRSDKFRTDMEYEDMAASLLPVLLDIDVEVMSCQVTDTRMYIKCVDKKVTRELAAIGGKFGDGKHNIVRCLSPAITISDSEVGYGGANVSHRPLRRLLLEPRHLQRAQSCGSTMSVPGTNWSARRTTRC